VGRAKRAANLAKHGVDFVDAAGIFAGPTLEWRDLRQDYREERWIAVGMVNRRELTVVYTLRGQHRRIISARRAHRNERRTYRAAYPGEPAQG
jgi:uncharacterized protein